MDQWNVWLFRNVNEYLSETQNSDRLNESHEAHGSPICRPCSRAIPEPCSGMELGGGCGRNTGTNTMIVFIFILMTIRRHNFRFDARAYLFVSSQCQYFVCVLRYVDSYAILNVALVGGMTTKWMSSADGKTWPTTIDDERGPPGWKLGERNAWKKKRRERKGEKWKLHTTNRSIYCVRKPVYYQVIDIHHVNAADDYDSFIKY